MGDGGDRRLGALDATLLVMGGIIGVGIFFTPQQAAQLVGSGAPILGVWILGGLVALCAAFTFAELGSSYPEAGGWFVYLKEAWGRLTAFLFAWVVLAVVSTGAAAAVTRFGVEMARTALPALDVGGELGRDLTAAGVVVVITLVALTGVRSAVRVQNATMLAKLVALGALVLCGLALVAPGEVAPATAGEPARTEGASLSGFLAALKPVFFAYGGWQMVAYIAPQVRDPARNLPRAIVLGVSAVILVYVLANASYLRALGVEGLAAERGFATRIAAAAAGSTGERLLAGGIAVSALGWCVVLILTSPWLYVAMAREGLFFEALGRVHPRRGVPTLALVVQMLVALGYVFAAGLDFLVNAVVFVEWIFHGLVAWGLLRLRARQRERSWPYRSPLHPLGPLVYTVAALAVFLSTLFGEQSSGEVVAAGLGVVAAGGLVYGAWSLRRGRA